LGTLKTHQQQIHLVGEKVFEFHRNFGGPKSSTWAIGEQQFYDFTPLLGTFLKTQLFGGRLSTPSEEIPLWILSVGTLGCLAQKSSNMISPVVV